MVSWVVLPPPPQRHPLSKGLLLFLTHSGAGWSLEDQVRTLAPPLCEPPDGVLTLGMGPKDQEALPVPLRPPLCPCLSCCLCLEPPPTFNSFHC